MAPPTKPETSVGTATSSDGRLICKVPTFAVVGGLLPVQFTRLTENSKENLTAKFTLVSRTLQVASGSTSLHSAKWLEATEPLDDAVVYSESPGVIYNYALNLTALTAQDGRLNLAPTSAPAAISPIIQTSFYLLVAVFNERQKLTEYDIPISIWEDPAATPFSPSFYPDAVPCEADYKLPAVFRLMGLQAPHPSFSVSAHVPLDWLAPIPNPEFGTAILVSSVFKNIPFKPLNAPCPPPKASFFEATTQ